MKNARLLSGVCFSYKQKCPNQTVRAISISELHAAGNLTAAEASGACVHVTGGSVNERLNTLYIGLPGTVGTPVGMAHLNTKGNAFSANFTFCHLSTSLQKPMLYIKPNYHSRTGDEMQEKFLFFYREFRGKQKYPLSRRRKLKNLAKMRLLH